MFMTFPDLVTRRLALGNGNSKEHKDSIVQGFQTITTSGPFGPALGSFPGHQVNVA